MRHLASPSAGPWSRRSGRRPGPGPASRTAIALTALILLSASEAAPQTAVAELRATPERWINREVTVVGRVIAAGATRIRIP